MREMFRQIQLTKLSLTTCLIKVSSIPIDETRGFANPIDETGPVHRRNPLIKIKMQSLTSLSLHSNPYLYNERSAPSSRPRAVKEKNSSRRHVPVGKT